jgi:hypothetical protein
MHSGLIKNVFFPKGTFCAVTFSITALGIMTFNMSTFGMKTLCITNSSYRHSA